MDTILGTVTNALSKGGQEKTDTEKEAEIRDICEQKFWEEKKKDLISSLDNIKSVMENSVKKIIRTICETIQTKKLDEITTLFLEDMRRFLSNLKEEEKDELSNIFINGPNKDLSDKNDNGTYFDCDKCASRTAPTTSPPQPKFNDDYSAENLLVYFTDAICAYIKEHPELLDVFIKSIHKRFKHYLTGGQNPGPEASKNIINKLSFLLGPIADKTRVKITNEVSSKIVEELLATAPDAVGINRADLDKMTTEQKDQKTIELATNQASRLQRKKQEKKEALEAGSCSMKTPDELLPIPTSEKEKCNVAQAWARGFGEAIYGKRRGGSSKTKINKKILGRNKSLKKKLKL